jgi:DNA-binding winged helix-turn-helix (wHTH) protein
MRYVFGDYILDTRRYELRRAGALIALRPKVFRLLVYLLAHRDRGDDLLAAPSRGRLSAGET